MNRLSIGLWFCLFLACAPGCGDGKCGVHGTVSYEGKLVESGSITFVSIEGDLVREGGVITDGGFSTRLPPGKYKIELTASRKAGSRTQKGFDGKDEVIELFEEVFPEYYNTNSELTEVIKPGHNTLKLELKKKR